MGKVLHQTNTSSENIKNIAHVLRNQLFPVNEGPLPYIYKNLISELQLLMCGSTSGFEAYFVEINILSVVDNILIIDLV